MRNSPLLPATVVLPTAPEKKNEHLANLPAASTFQIFAQPGANINHPNPAKCAETLFQKALALRPKTIIFHMDIMNSLTSPPCLQNSTVKYSRSFYENYLCLKEKPTIKSVVVLCRRRNEDKTKLAPGIFREPGDAPLP